VPLRLGNSLPQRFGNYSTRTRIGKVARAFALPASTRRRKIDALGLGADGERAARRILYGEHNAVDRVISRKSIAS
jgi:hypothetical protein